MLFYGTRAANIKKGRINNVVCPHCDALTSMSYGIFGKYAHLYWIPTFPIGRVAIIECNSCKKTYTAKELPDSIKTKFDFEKQGARVPIWHFSGLIIVACLIAGIAYSSSRDDANEKVYLQEPAIGDVYSITSETYGMYSAMRINQVTRDSIFVIYNDYEIDKSYKIDEIDKEVNYTNQFDSFSRQELLDLYEEEIIYEIDRDN